MLRTRQLVVNSRMRSLELYPNTWQYVVALPDRLRNVVRVALVQAVLPNSQLTVHRFNCYLQLALADGVPITVTLPAGNREPTLLMAELQGLLAAYLAGVSVTLDPATARVTIAAAEPFSLLFSTGTSAANSIHRALGFASSDTPLAQSVTGAYTLQLPPAAYVTVAVDEVPESATMRYLSNAHESGPQFSGQPEQAQRNVLALVPLDNAYNTNKFYTAERAGDEACTQFSQQDMAQLTIRLYDDQGAPYDSNGADHTLVFAVTTAEPGSLAVASDRLPFETVPACGATMVQVRRDSSVRPMYAQARGGAHPGPGPFGQDAAQVRVPATEPGRCGRLV